MKARTLVVVGASAGGVEALCGLAGGLPSDLDAAVLMVLHMPRTGPSALTAIIARSTSLPVGVAVDGEPLLSRRIYLAQPDRHLLVLDGHIRLSRGPAENGHRPAVDPLFRSAARAFGSAVIGIVLSGARDDGTAGMASIVQHGGVGLVQDPSEALHGSMPQNVLEHVRPCEALPVAELGQRIAELVKARPADAEVEQDQLLDTETAMANFAPITTDDLKLAHPSGLACPSCHGALFELPGEPAPRYRCRVGHAWSPETLLDSQSEALEGALWMALRALEEKSALHQRMAEASRQRGSARTADRLAQAGVEAADAGGLIRDLIERLDRVTAGSDGASPGTP